jgi:hypothetical protein
MVSFKKIIKQKKGIKLFRFDAFLDAVEMQKTAFICCQRNWKWGIVFSIRRLFHICLLFFTKVEIKNGPIMFPPGANATKLFSFLPTLTNIS